MERRTSLAIALATGGTVAAASAALAVNVGLLRPDTEAPNGVLDANMLDASFGTDTTLPSDPTVVTVFVDDPPAHDATETSDATDSTTPTTAESSTDDDRLEGDDEPDDDEVEHDEVEHDEDRSGSGHDDDD